MAKSNIAKEDLDLVREGTQDIRASLGAAIDEVSLNGGGSDTVSVVSPHAASDAADDDIEYVEEADDDTDDDGQSEGDDRTEAEAGEADDDRDADENEDAESVLDDDATGKNGAQSENPIEPPQHWAEADRATFKEQTPKAQRWLLDRHKSMEGDYTRRVQEIAPITKALDRWKPYIQARGTSSEQVIETLLGVEHQLYTGSQDQKQEVFAKLANDYGVDLDALYSHRLERQAEDESMDPAVKALKQELDGVRSEFSNFKTQSQQSEEQAQAARIEAANNKILAFREMKTEAGEPAHPYFSDVEADMAALAIAERQAGREPDLQQLYDRAIWANPSVRATMLAAETSAADSKRREADRQKVAKAKKAASSISGSPNGSATRAQPKLGIRDNIEQAWS